MVNAILVVTLSVGLVVVAKYSFNKGKMSNFEFTTYILGIAGGSLVMTEDKNLFGYIGLALFCSAAILKIVDLNRRRN